MQIPDLLFYRANKYVMITFGALPRKYKHTPLNTLSSESGTHPQILEGAPRHVTDTSVLVQCLLPCWRERFRTGPELYKGLGEKQVKRVEGAMPSLLWSL